MIRFVWARLIHAPHPNNLLYADSHRSDYLIGSDSNFGTGINLYSNLVKILVSVSFDIQSFSPNFSYRGRTIATPFLSTAGLEDPVRDWRLLGNCVYSPGLNLSNPWSFKDFFTGADDLGYYDFNSVLFGADKEASMLSKHAVVKYYIVDPSSLETRISRFFNGYDQARSFAEKIFTDEGEKIKSFFLLPVMIRSCIRHLKHPIGIFAYVKTMAGSINASELLFDFKKRLKHGGDK